MARKVTGRNITRRYPSGNRYEIGELTEYYRSVQTAGIERPFYDCAELTVAVRVDLSLGNIVGNIVSTFAIVEPA